MSVERTREKGSGHGFLVSGLFLIVGLGLLSRRVGKFQVVVDLWGMEGGLEEEERKANEGENKSKRKMKTGSQLEVLGKAYAAEAYPLEALRAELSVKLSISDRQPQMSFCNRRLKGGKTVQADGKIQNDYCVAGALMGEGVEQVVGADVRHDHGLASGTSGHLDSQQVVHWPGIMAFPRFGAGSLIMESSSYNEPHWTVEVLQAIALVERQLGETLREDGPILGMEFDSLPPGAFGAPIGAVTTGKQRQCGGPFEAKIYEPLDKGISRTLHEYQFIPEKPTVRNETYEKVVPSFHYSSLDGVWHSGTLLSSGRSFLNGNESAPYGYGIQGQIPGLNLLSQQGRQNHLVLSASGENDGSPQKNPFVNDIHSGAHPISLVDSPLMPSGGRVIHAAELSSSQRKRKNKEARMHPELEAQEKKIRKEVQKQDILRQKREEQIKKQMKRQEPERRKEKERLLRERQREEERYQRQQRRELERQEKFLQKELIRAENLRQKEELTREKEEARIKAANERAVARRIAKESIELIEDECLELIAYDSRLLRNDTLHVHCVSISNDEGNKDDTLDAEKRMSYMDLAASKKGLSSILALDYETFQNIELYADGRTSFPPKSVQLKKIFSSKPWSDSNENVGNLLMVWRFLITFADILGIWLFTLDELIQAFHDHDPRLLGEIHIALLKSILKDIEDVERIPSTGLGCNQNSVANSGGGHPQIIEGAYLWGFDIRNWQQHFNPLTWPEILQQFALSAGFGPQLKKQNIKQGNDGRDIILNLRSGAPTENAVAIMQEKGLSNPRRSRHRLTPGTVKFAAFHVLSLEGSKGLNILEVADKIQASIGAVLSRDAKLFERTAPSTYCVRLAYRKDPADSEAIYSAARERIRIFKSGFVNAEEADGSERDEDSECDMAEDPQIENLGTETNTKKESSNYEEFNPNSAMKNRNDSVEILQTHDTCHEKVSDDLATIVAENFNEHKDVSSSTEIAVCNNDVVNPYVEGIDVDENIPDEPWERLEAENASKKQMWAEAQLDKRCIKEVNFVKMQSISFLGKKNEPTVAFPSVERKECPLHIVDSKNSKHLLTSHDLHELSNELRKNQNHLQSSPLEINTQMQDCSTGPDNYSFQQSRYAVEKSRSNLMSYISHLAEKTYIHRSLPLGLDRRRNRYWQFTTSAQNDPGCSRIFVELHDGQWKLIDSEEDFDALLASLDVRGIRESHLHMMLQRIEMNFKESVKRNVQNVKMRMQIGDPIKRLKIEAVEMAFDQDCSTDNHGSTPLRRNETDNNDAFMRYWDFEKWMHKECLNSSVLCAMKFGKKRCCQHLSRCDLCLHVYFSWGASCPSCHRTFNACKSNPNSSEHILQAEGKVKIGINCFHASSPLPLRMRLLKIFLSIIEVIVCFMFSGDGSVSLWVLGNSSPRSSATLWRDNYRKYWSKKLDDSSSSEDFLQISTALEGAIKREYLDSNYETTGELLGLVSSSGCRTSNSIDGERMPVLPWQKLESEKDKNIGKMGGFSGKSGNLLDGNHYNFVGGDDGGQIDLDVEDYIIGGDSDTEDNREENAEQNMYLDVRLVVIRLRRHTRSLAAAFGYAQLYSFLHTASPLYQTACSNGWGYLQIHSDAQISICQIERGWLWNKTYLSPAVHVVFIVSMRDPPGVPTRGKEYDRGPQLDRGAEPMEGSAMGVLGLAGMPNRGGSALGVLGSAGVPNRGRECPGGPQLGRGAEPR
ncbi:hypothetical protein Fmac_021602 [Flemingia macrophylla]|uniref:Uncharacterized protein n=1 Tax=Flemingia macrophylla TaxID=520843 RepID=A0ABD1LZ52_9FABA